MHIYIMLIYIYIYMYRCIEFCVNTCVRKYVHAFTCMEMYPHVSNVWRLPDSCQAFCSLPPKFIRAKSVIWWMENCKLHGAYHQVGWRLPLYHCYSLPNYVLVCYDYQEPYKTDTKLQHLLGWPGIILGSTALGNVTGTGAHLPPSRGERWKGEREKLLIERG